ncbi:MAG TPA: hypothetical protein VMU56_04990 [Beijerinckiaceae bacterium]|nr:hypothetical protein [Beijerinckiaceae bacterium]HVB88714.1 hypothetical protein [Beijerinckiaceae bacterium]
MQPEIRRIIAVEAHRRRTGRCPSIVYSLGTGESFDIAQTIDGFIDVRSGVQAKSDGSRLVLTEGHGPVQLDLAGDVGFTGCDLDSNERFSGRAGGGATVTLYDDQQLFFQFAVSFAEDQGGSGEHAGAVRELP